MTFLTVDATICPRHNKPNKLTCERWSQYMDSEGAMHVEVHSVKLWWCQRRMLGGWFVLKNHDGCLLDVFFQKAKLTWKLKVFFTFGWYICMSYRRGEIMIQRSKSFKAFDLGRLMASSTCNFHGTKRKTRESLELSSWGGGEWLNGWMVGKVWSGRGDAQVVSPSHYVVMWSSREKSGKLRPLSAFHQTSILQFRCLESSQRKGSGGKRLLMHCCTTRSMSSWTGSKMTTVTREDFNFIVTFVCISSIATFTPWPSDQVRCWVTFLGYGKLFDAIGTRVPYCQFDSLKKLTSQNQLRCGNVGRVVHLRRC